MKKGLSKEQLLYKAIELMRDKKDIRSANIRMLARELGCTHPNIYNYYPSLDSLFFDAYHKVLEIFLDSVSNAVSNQGDDNAKLETYFSQIIDFYFDNKGWFRLLWFEIFGEDKKEILFMTASRTVDSLVSIMENILVKLNGRAPERIKIKRTIHVIHCYIYGEISIYMSNHSFVHYTSFLEEDSADMTGFLTRQDGVSDDEYFRVYIRDEAIRILNMYLMERER